MGPATTGPSPDQSGVEDDLVVVIPARACVVRVIAVAAVLVAAVVPAPVPVPPVVAVAEVPAVVVMAVGSVIPVAIEVIAPVVEVVAAVTRQRAVPHGLVLSREDPFFPDPVLR